MPRTGLEPNDLIEEYRASLANALSEVDEARKALAGGDEQAACALIAHSGRYPLFQAVDGQKAAMAAFELRGVTPWLSRSDG